MLIRFITVIDLSNISMKFPEKVHNIQSQNKFNIMSFKKITFVLLFVFLCSCQSGSRQLQTDGFSDPYCVFFDQQSGDCQACFCRAYFDRSRVCQLVSDLCQTWNINTGQCTSCYGGYDLANGECTIMKLYIPKNGSLDLQNLNCQTQSKNGSCLSCRLYYFLHCNDCQTTGENPFCSKFDNVNLCVDCDFGYELDINFVCQVQGSFDDNSTDNSTDDGNQTVPDTEKSTYCNGFPNCDKCTLDECTKCGQGYRQQYWSRQCVLPSPKNCAEGCSLCSPNECFYCSQGYSSQSFPPCQSCSFMYSRNSQGKCKAIQRDCSAYPNCKSCLLGECSICEQGFTLNSNLQCVPQA